MRSIYIYGYGYIMGYYDINGICNVYNIYIYMFPCWEIPHEMDLSMYSNRWSG